MHVVTRFPPSPTGTFHIGSARTALFNYLFAAHHKGTMYLRFEDTDKSRSKPEFEQDILEGLQWLGIPYTLPTVYRQSERTSVYRTELKRLLEADAAYESDEEASDGSGRAVRVVRLRNPGQAVTFSDLLRGDVTFHTAELGDFVIARSIDDPLYHLTVVVDDHEMGVTHVLRGEDHISNTARQILILEALGFTRPLYAHIPLILAPDRSKLSKRHGATSVTAYRRDGFLPEAMVNYLALLGWNPGGERELFSLQELSDAFTLEHVQKAGAIFDIEKLTWFNREHLRRIPLDQFETRLREYAALIEAPVPAHLPRALALLMERASTLKEALELLTTEYAFLAESLEAFDGALLIKGAKTDAGTAASNLARVHERILALPEAEFTKDAVRAVVFPYAEEAGRAQVLWPMRVALSGKERSPDPFTLAGTLGKQRTLERLDRALEMLGAL